MLLNEVQRLATQIAADHGTVATLVAQHESDAAKIASLEQQLRGIQVALNQLQSGEKLVAQR